MAKAKQELHLEYIDASPVDFSQSLQDAVAKEREIYQALKAQKAIVIALLKAEVVTRPQREVKYTAYTQWGQWQIVVGDIVAPKAKPANRQNYADWQAQQMDEGRAQ